ncbi:MAG: transposase [Solirubrobacterales bacterium]|nr:transposase [Solirubrobacterales bacterium]
MGQNFLACDRDQVMLLPPDLRDWLPAGHLARFVIETVEQLDLEPIYGYYRADGRGRPAHDPAMMVALLLYCYAVGVRSSRAIERRCVEDVACRVITANRQPDHATIARFRVRHEAALSALFFALLALCRQAGMVKVGTVAVDSTKLAANASADQNRTLAGLEEEARRILKEAGETDAREDELYGDRRGDELPEDLADPETRAARIRELLEAAQAQAAQAEAARREIQQRNAEHQVRTGKRASGRPPRPGLSTRQRERIATQKYNLTDPDSGVVRHRGMLFQGYNVQTAVADGQVILATRVNGLSPDSGQLAPTIAAAEENLSRVGITEAITEVLADSGYWNARQISALKARGKRVLIPPALRQKRGRQTHPEVHAMHTALARPENQTAYKRRQQIVEPVYAHIKHHRGITRVLRRGKQAVQAEIDLIATTHNLLKLYRHSIPAS